MGKYDFDFEDDDFDDDDEFEETPPQRREPENLRKAYEKLKRDLKARDTRLAEYERKEQVSSVKSTLEAKGMNPKLANLIMSQVKEPTDEAVNQWLADYGDLFAGNTNASDAQPTGGAEAEATKNNQFFTPEEQGGLDLFNRVENSSAGAAPAGIEDFASMMKKTESNEELLKLIAQGGFA